MSSWFTKISNSKHSFAVDELNFKCSEIVYSEFIEIICNATRGESMPERSGTPFQ